MGIVADLADREQVAGGQEQLAERHADVNLPVNSAGSLVPKPFLDQDGADYDAYFELNRATFFLFHLEGSGGLDSRLEITAACL